VDKIVKCLLEGVRCSGVIGPILVVADVSSYSFKWLLF